MKLPILTPSCSVTGHILYNENSVLPLTPRFIHNSGEKMSEKVGFDNELYLKKQNDAISDRVKIFGDKLYLEFGGKVNTKNLFIK